MNKLTQAKRAQIISTLVEGNSIRATCRMTGAAKGTVLKLLVDLGRACAAYQDRNDRTGLHVTLPLTRGRFRSSAGNDPQSHRA